MTNGLHVATVLITNLHQIEVEVKSKSQDDDIHLKTYTTMEHVIEVHLKQWISLNQLLSSCSCSHFDWNSLTLTNYSTLLACGNCWFPHLQSFQGIHHNR